MGDTQERRRLAILNLETGDGVWAGLEGVVDPVTIPKPLDKRTARKRRRLHPKRRRAAPAKRDIRWGTLFSFAEMLEPRSRPYGPADNTERWLVVVDPATGRTRIVDALRDEAWVRDIGPASNVSGGLGWLPDNRRVWFLAEHDGWMHLYTGGCDCGDAPIASN